MFFVLIFVNVVFTATKVKKEVSIESTESTDRINRGINKLLNRLTITITFVI